MTVIVIVRPQFQFQLKVSNGLLRFCFTKRTRSSGSQCSDIDALMAGLEVSYEAGLARPGHAVEVERKGIGGIEVRVPAHVFHMVGR